MKSEEFKTGLKMLKAGYPFLFHGLVGNEYNAAVRLWYESLQDIPGDLFFSAIKRLIVTETKTPNIAMVREMVMNSQRNDATVDDAWGMVQTVIRDYGTYGQLQAMRMLPPMVADVVRKLGYRKLCLSEDTMVDRAHFIKFYSEAVKRKEEMFVIPESMRLESERRRYEQLGTGG